MLSGLVFFYQTGLVLKCSYAATELYVLMILNPCVQRVLASERWRLPFLHAYSNPLLILEYNHILCVEVYTVCI